MSNEFMHVQVSSRYVQLVHVMCFPFRMSREKSRQRKTSCRRFQFHTSLSSAIVDEVQVYEMLKRHCAVDRSCYGTFLRNL